jgi:hypothetical protein
MHQTNSPSADPNDVDQLLSRLRMDLVEHFAEVGSDPGIRCLRLFDVWRQVSLRRIVDLADGAEAFFVKERLVPACTLTRSVVETVAIQYTVWKKVSSLIGSANSKGVHALLMSAVFGRRDTADDRPNKSLNVLTAVNHLDKRFPGFRSEYDRLSEYLHPGLAGGYGVYVRTEGTSLRTHFGQNPFGLQMGPWGRGELERALLVATTFNDLLRETRFQLASMVAHGASTASSTRANT